MQLAVVCWRLSINWACLPIHINIAIRYVRKKELYTPEHRAVAREVAAETFVLLKNENHLLPLEEKGKIALIGPMAECTQ